MYHGISLITKESKIDESIRKQLCDHPFFQTPITNLDNQSTFIKDYAKSEFDSLILQFLDEEQYNYSNNYIEYWFQKYDNTNPLGLFPHCDYNDIYRVKMKDEPEDWPHKLDPNLIVSPITIAVYLEISNDLEGGELNISHRTWYEEQYPISVYNSIKQHPFETIVPTQGSVIYFKGSEHYHWINPVIKGCRKSMLINFWPKDLDQYSD